MSRPFTTLAAIEARLRELGMSPRELADNSGVPYETVRYFGMLDHDPQTLEQLSAALGWPPSHLRELLYEDADPLSGH